MLRLHKNKYCTVLLLNRKRLFGFPSLGFFIIGGWSSSDTNGKTTLLFSNGNWNPGPELPEPGVGERSCVTQLNCTHTMVMGGIKCKDCAFMLDWSKPQPAWVPVASMKEDHSYRPSCATLPDNYVMVANGNSNEKENFENELKISVLVFSSKNLQEHHNYLSHF